MKFICKLKITYSFTGLLFICSFMLIAMFSQENRVSADSVPTLVTKNLTVYAVSGDFYKHAKEAVVTAIDSKGNRVEGVDYYNGPIKYSIVYQLMLMVIGLQINRVYILLLILIPKLKLVRKLTCKPMQQSS